MADNKVEYLIEILKRGNGAKEAVQDLQNVEASSKKTDASLKDFGRNAKAAFAAIGGVAVIKDALNEFLESEKAVAKLNRALINTNQYSPETSKNLQQLAENMRDMTNIPDDAIVNVMGKLVALGAKSTDVQRLTYAVFDLYVLFDRDLNKATLAMARALQGDTHAFSELGIQVDETKTATEQFNDTLKQLEKLAGGQAKEAADSLSGKMEALKLTIKELKQELGFFIAEGVSGFSKLSQAIGEMSARGDQIKSLQGLKDTYMAMADAQRKMVLEQKELGKISAQEAENFLKRLTMIQDNIRYIRPTYSTSASQLEQWREGTLPQAGALLGDMEMRLAGRRAPTGTPVAPSAPGNITSPGLDAKERERIQKEADARFEATLDAAQKYEEEQVREEQQLQQQLERELEERNRIAMERQRQAQEVADYERALENQTLLIGLEGRKLELEQLRQTHEDRVTQIQRLKYEDEDRYMQLMDLEKKLYETEKKRVEFSHSANARLQRDLKQVGATAVEAFSQGMAGALIDAFSEGDKAFQRFAANFLRMIAEMILQSLILYAIQSMMRAMGFSFMGGGGQASAGKAANGTVRYAATGLQTTNMEGVAAVDQATLFPKFNVVAGEAGKEMLTVLANPVTASIGGMQAQIGKAGNRRLAIVDANSLLAFAGPRRLADGGSAGTGTATGDMVAGGGGGRAGGLVEVLLRLEPGLRAEIVKQAVASAKVEITSDMTRESNLSTAVKSLIR